MGSDLSSVQTHRQNRFDNHVVYNSNNNVGNNQGNNQPMNYNSNNQRSLELKNQTMVVKNELMIIEDSVKLIEKEQSYKVGLDIFTLVDIDIELYFFVEEIVEEFHMNTRSFKFMNKKHSNKYVASIKKDNKAQFISFNQIKIDRKDMKQKGWKDNEYFMVIRLIKNDMQSPQVVCYFYGLNQDLKVKLQKSKMIYGDKEYTIQQIFGINDCSFNIAQLQKEEPDLCTICMTEKIDIIIMPCRHMCICMSCVNDFQRVQNNAGKKCPLCRKDINSFIRLSC